MHHKLVHGFVPPEWVREVRNPEFIYMGIVEVLLVDLVWVGQPGQFPCKTHMIVRIKSRPAKLGIKLWHPELVHVGVVKMLLVNCVWVGQPRQLHCRTLNWQLCLKLYRSHMILCQER